MSNLLEGKLALILGIANKWSLAYAIAQAFWREGATLALTYLGDRQKVAIEELSQGLPVAGLWPCDVTKEEDLLALTEALRDQRPVAGRIVQFSGGEPTIYPRFLDALRLAKEMGFSHTQVATNGLKFTDLEFAEQCKEAGLHTLYLQFDGTCDEVYRRTRGESLCEKKLQCIENVKKAGLKIVFVPTIVKGLNDHEIGDIVRLALEYIECTSGIS